MSKIKTAFEGKKAFIPFLTAGDPSIEKTVEFVLTLVEAGADLIEIGIPFSDPMAEGVVIQNANLRALSSGTTVQDVFWAVEKIREKSDIPLVFLTYLNPVHKFGYEHFFDKCRQTGIDGIIIPDLPYEEKAEVLEFTQKNNVDLISLVAPTSAERIKMIAREAEGFIYVVSSMGVTGVRSEITTDIASMAASVKSATQLPVAVGFGIHTPAQAREMARIADGVIVGSAIVKIAAEYGENAGPHIHQYVSEMKKAIR